MQSATRLFHAITLLGVVSTQAEAACGLFGLGIFCPLPGNCGFLRRLLNLNGCGSVGRYAIDLDFVGVSASDQSFFTTAVSRWKSIIRGDLADIETDSLDPPSPGCAYPAVIDDLYICATFVVIDGPGTVLGSAGPIYTRISDGLTITGQMRFDSADIRSLISEGNFGTVILHEMGHVLGKSCSLVRVFIKNTSSFLFIVSDV
jgi:hypothetical protein